jgi:hypothetical protein
LVISIFQLAHKKEPVHTIPIAPQLKVLAEALEENQFLSSGPEDCEPSDPEDFGKGGVEVESEYDLELRIGSNMGRLVMVLTVPNKTVRW